MSKSSMSKTVVFRRRQSSPGKFAYYNVTQKRDSNLNEILSTRNSGMRVKVLSHLGLAITKSVLTKAANAAKRRAALLTF